MATTTTTTLTRMAYEPDDDDLRDVVGGGGGDNDRKRRRRLKSRQKKSCNSQICCAYLMSILAVTLIIGGMYLSYIHWTKGWLLISAIGIVVNLMGSCMYYSGTNQLYYQHHRHQQQTSGAGGGSGGRSEHIYENRTNRSRHRRRYRSRGLSTDQLMPSAPPLNQSRSVSQLSLNMIPQYFCSAAATTAAAAHSDTESTVISMATQSAAAANPLAASISPLTTLSQIFSVNGQSYLILPLNGEPLNSANSFPLQNLVVKLTDNESKTVDKPDGKHLCLQREEQSCQTDIVANDRKNGSIRCKDVQMQTISRGGGGGRHQLAEPVGDNQRYREQLQNCSQSYQLIQSTSSATGFGHQVMANNGCSASSSNETHGNSLEPFGVVVVVDKQEDNHQTVVETLIDLNDSQPTDGPSTSRQRSTGHMNDTQITSSSSGGQTLVTIDDNDSQCFDSLLSDNNTVTTAVGEDHMHINDNDEDDVVDVDSLSVHPPRYEDVIQCFRNYNNNSIGSSGSSSSDDQQIIVDYGTL
ncbi:uncharacterized protein LOC128954572 [Oppia nitens]|uniref:uncharacterized protein LOC128954572 n=1 Tax=Oppia nitens TaxID=1686743 RepID=UPI0023DA577B|nr:uncharacterized protein LOC128954572 [Oppia nitens]